MTDSDLCRKAFEKFMVDGFNYPIDTLGKYDDGTYWDIPVQDHWEVFQEAWNASRENIIKLQSKLAEYENMEPVAYMIFDENFNEPMAYKDNKEEAEQSLSFYRRVCCCKIIPLYRHPNK
ncbi:hypothetical protein ACNFJN_08810 [Xenorhabdus budapestensis]|uniref:hypothetical protein n=1 Tax=Xenorhabdus budapestensis TaxID=290110 RepID=UPI003A88E114